jgi:RNA polymerase sigma-70 factor (ECF subfamily)
MTELSLRPRDEFDEVLERYSAMVYRLAFARVKNVHDANDITQEVFLKYVQSGKEFTEEEHRRAWLIRVTLNASKTFFFSAWNRHRAGEELPDDEGAPDKELESVDTKSAVMDAVRKLPQKYRTVIHLFYYEDLSIIKICELTGQSENTVKSQLHRARNMLKVSLEGIEFDDV